MNEFQVPSRAIPRRCDACQMREQPPAIFIIEHHEETDADSPDKKPWVQTGSSMSRQTREEFALMFNYTLRVEGR